MRISTIEFARVVMLAAAAGLGACNSGTQPILQPRPVEVDDPTNLLGVFEGTIPCVPTPLPITGHPLPYPGDGECQRIKVRLELYHDAEGVPIRYVLHRINVGLGDDVTTTEGAWTRTQGTNAGNEFMVYELDAETPTAFRRFFVADENILLLLNANRQLLVGNASLSFTLSRTR